MYICMNEYIHIMYVITFCSKFIISIDVKNIKNLNIKKKQKVEMTWILIHFGVILNFNNIYV